MNLKKAIFFSFYLFIIYDDVIEILENCFFRQYQKHIDLCPFRGYFENEPEGVVITIPTLRARDYALRYNWQLLKLM